MFTPLNSLKHVLLVTSVTRETAQSVSPVVLFCCSYLEELSQAGQANVRVCAHS